MHATHRARRNGAKQQAPLSSHMQLSEEAPEQGRQAIRPEDSISWASWLQLPSSAGALSARELAGAVKFSDRVSQRSPRRASVSHWQSFESGRSLRALCQPCIERREKPP
eukprot:3666854-Pyramimonas_sp.AAC.1